MTNPDLDLDPLAGPLDAAVTTDDQKAAEAIRTAHDILARIPGNGLGIKCADGIRRMVGDLSDQELLNAAVHARRAVLISAHGRPGRQGDPA